VGPSTPNTIPQTGGAAKDQDLHFSVPPPGDALVGAIQDRGEEAPAWSVWHVYDLHWLVPQLTGSTSPEEVVGEVLDPWALEVTRTGSSSAYEQTKEQERAKLRTLAVAAQRDLLGTPESDLAQWWWCCSDDSAVTRSARKGRALWRELRAWPWCVCPPGPLPTEWWLLPEVRSAFGAWSEVRGARIRVRSMKDGREVF
jgi:hypothetical protein